MNEPTADLLPSALPPTEAEAAAWAALSREQQVARYRAILTSPEASQVSKSTMREILEAARQSAQAGV